MFSNLKIAVRLGAAFGVMVLLIGIAAVLYLTRLGTIEATTQATGQERYPKVTMSNDMIARSLNNGILVRELALLKDKAKLEQTRERILENRKKNSDDLVRIEKLISSEKGHQLVKDITEKRNALNSRYTKLFEFVPAEHEKMTAFIFNEYTPSNQAYVSALQALVNYQSELMAASLVDVSTSVHNMRNLALGTSGLTLVLAVLLGLWITRSITVPLKTALEASNQLAKGDLTIKIKTGGKDEIGQLLMSMSQMVAKLSEVMTAVRSGADGIAAASGPGQRNGANVGPGGKRASCRRGTD